MAHTHVHLDEHSARDGRAERGERTREAVVTALIALLEEGDLRPTAERIAKRAGVGLRTVFHHFEDLESLHALVAERQLALIASLATPVPPDLPLPERIAAFVAQRAAVLEAVTPVRRAAVLAEPFSDSIAHRLRTVRQIARREVERVFARELDARDPRAREETLHALAVATGWSTWESLRSHQALAPEQARAVLARTVHALLTSDPASAPR